MINSEDKLILTSGNFLLRGDILTNFTYEITGILNPKQIIEINNICSKHRLHDRLIKIKEYGCNFKFCGLENEIFNANLQMIGSWF